MESIKERDVVVFTGDDKDSKPERYEVAARCSNIVWLRRLYKDSKRGPVEDAIDIQDLIAYGYAKETLPSYELELLSEAWGIIANAHDFDAGTATPEWLKAAKAWRNKYHTLLDK